MYCRTVDSSGEAYIFVAGSFSALSVFNHCDTVGPKATKFSEITQNKGNYAVEGHSRSPMLVPVQSPYVSAYDVSIIVTCILSCTDSEISRIIGPVFSLDRDRDASLNNAHTRWR